MTDRPELADIPNPEARLDELEVQIERLGRDALVERLVDRLDDPYPPVRHRAARALGARLDEALDALFCAVLRDADPSTVEARADASGLETRPQTTPEWRHAASLLLGHADSEESRRALLEGTNDESADVRYQSLVGLHRRGSIDDALQSAVTARLDDTDTEVATVAAQMAAEFGWTELTEALERRWQELSGDVRLQFAISLAELAGRHGASLEVATMHELVDDLSEGLRDETTVAGAARGLVMLDSERARQPLRDVLDRWFVHPLLRVEAASALIELDDPRGRDYLDDAFDSGRKDVRGYAIRVAGRLGLDDYFDHVVDIARADDYHADTAVVALAEWNHDRSASLLETIADSHADSDVRDLADRALAELRRPGDFRPTALDFPELSEA